MEHTATYSPEDNKLRLYPACRLDPEEYQRVRAAGFIWAPKQKLFVAPMWTPQREDFLLAMCGEIGDEDTSLVERAEAKAERLEELSERKSDEADRAHKAVHAIADNIPLGQPILIGHHSEKHARKDAEKIENGMRKAVDCWKAANYWKERAAGALRLAKYKERPDVRARRIKTLEADKRREERSQAQARLFLKLWENDAAAIKRTDGGESTFLIRAKFISNRDHISKCFPLAEYPRPEGASNYEGSMSLWSALGGSDSVPIITAEQARDIAVRCHERTIEHTQRWIDHVENRLAYERAMLGDAGGTAADANKPEKGGAVRCWVRRGWCEIVKVNRVSISVADNWGNGGKDFLRTVPFTDLKEIIGKAQYDAIKAGGPDPEPPEQPTPAAEPPIEDNVCPDGALCPDPECIAERTRQDVQFTRATDDDFRAMLEQLKQGVKVVVAPQLFPTPPDLAARMVEAAKIEPHHRVLEPSAGTGNLLRAIGPGPDKVAVEINQQLLKPLAMSESGLRVYSGDFLEEQPDGLGQFDRVVMNPPFHNGADIRHIEHALTFLKPGGRLVALCANGPKQQLRLRALAENSGGWWEDLPAGSFTEQGTNVNVALLVIEN